MLAALVIFGAVACTENQEENIPQEEQKAILSFVANIDVDDETRTVLEQVDGQWTTNWTGNDKLYVSVDGGTRYEFVNSPENKEVFNCYTEGVEELRSQNVTIDNGADFDSTKGVNGGSLSGVGSNFPYETVTLTVDNAFFRFSSQNEVTLTASADIFVEDGNTTNSVTIPANTDNWVAFLPDSGEVTFSYSIGGEKCKEITKNFEAKKIYNLGFLGAKSGWEISDGTRFYTTETPDLFVAKNVKLAGNKFCLHKVGDTAWGAGAKYGLVTAGTKSENTAIGLYSANWAGDITISNATTTAHDIYFDRANSRLYVMTVGTHPSTVSEPTNSNWYNIAGSMNGWGNYTAAQKFVYSGDNVWHLVIDFKANDEFKVQLKNNWDNPNYGHYQIQESVGRGLTSDSSGNAKIKTAGTYEIWVIPDHGDVPLYIIKR